MEQRIRERIRELLSHERKKGKALYAGELVAGAKKPRGRPRKEHKEGRALYYDDADLYGNALYAEGRKPRGRPRKHAGALYYDDALYAEGIKHKTKSKREGGKRELNPKLRQILDLAKKLKAKDKSLKQPEAVKMASQMLK